MRRNTLISAMAAAGIMAGTIAARDPSLQDDLFGGDFDDLLAPGYVPTFEVFQGPKHDGDILTARPMMQRYEEPYGGLDRSWRGSGGKKYAMEKGRSKDARKARAAMRRNRK